MQCRGEVRGRSVCPLQVAATWLLFALFTWPALEVSAKTYDRCELAREIRNYQELPGEIATWVCIAKHESHFNTSAVNTASGDHGIFQISQLYWCSPPGKGEGCGLSCDQLTDENLEDDLNCVRRIYRAHQRISGNGFTAWVVYKRFCTGDVSKYIEGCFNEDNSVIRSQSSEVENVKPAAKSLNNIPIEQKSSSFGVPFQLSSSQIKDFGPSRSFIMNRRSNGFSFSLI